MKYFILLHVAVFLLFCGIAYFYNASATTYLMVLIGSLVGMVRNCLELINDLCKGKENEWVDLLKK